MKTKYLLIVGAGVVGYLLLSSRGQIKNAVVADEGSKTTRVIDVLYNEVVNMGKSLVGEPRGIRNNNPGNLENNGIQWQGLSKDQSGDSRFYVFSEPLWGIRALARDIWTKYRRGIKTPSDFVSVYAPAFENNTGAYARSLAKTMGIGVDDDMRIDYVPNHINAVRGVIKHENGKQPYSASLISDAVMRARQ